MTENQTPPPAATPAPTINYQTPGSYQGPEPDKDARTMGMLCHLLALSGFVIPFGAVIGPLVIWLIKKDSSPFVDDQGKESLNFQITAAIALVISLILIFVFIGFLLIPAIAITDLVFVIIATVKANQGIAYRYPISLRLIK